MSERILQGDFKRNRPKSSEEFGEEAAEVISIRSKDDKEEERVRVAHKAFEREHAMELIVFESLVERFACGTDVEPHWCVWGYDYQGGKGVLYWIRQDSADQFVARRIAHILTALGGSATAEKTRWNPTLAGKAIYQDNAVLDL